MRQASMFFSVIVLSFLSFISQAQQTRTFIQATEIPGEVTVAGFEHQVEALSYSQASSGCPVDLSTNKTTACKINASGFDFQMAMTSATIVMRKLMYLGTHIPQVTVSFTKVTAAGQSVYYRITLFDVVISTVAESGSSEIPFNSVEFSPSRVKWEYFKPDNTSEVFTWDYKAAKTF